MDGDQAGKLANISNFKRPSREQALEAVRTLLAWAGDDPDREGLSETPRRVVEVYARRLQTQEALTQQIVDAINDGLDPAGVAVLIDAEHQCMTTRGIHHRHVSTITSHFTGAFKTDLALQERFLSFCARSVSR